jgi:glycosyltransferase involved in cell wall biosynthesis
MKAIKVPGNERTRCIMGIKGVPEIQTVQREWGTSQDEEHIGCSVGIMAYNEEANISHTIHAVLEQQGPSMRIEEIIVVASGCTDNTVPIVTEIALKEPRVRLCVQEKREGKASAINMFLKQAVSPVAVLIGADVLPEASALEYLCSPFKDPKIGMVGGHPVPVNNPATFMGHAVHLLWRLHDQLARIHPKLGEVVAFRNVISGIPSDSPVDEISIQALISQLDYDLIYEPACIVYNKGPLTIRDFLKQRRRIYAGHLKVRDQQKYAASTMKIGPIVRQLIASRHFALGTPRRIVWTLGTIFLEMVARLQGRNDYLQKREHHIWQMVNSTKDLEEDRQRVWGTGNALSVIIFRVILEDSERYHSDPESEDRMSTEAVRKLLPLLRASISKEDKFSINGPGIMTIVVRADQQGAESVAKRIQEIVQATPVRIGMIGREVKVMVTYSSLTFPLRAQSGSMTVSHSQVHQTTKTVQGTQTESALS